MSIEIIIAILGLFITIVINIATIAYFAGVLKANQAHQKEMIDVLRTETKENFDRLEKKQDKHNNLVERVAINEKDIAVMQEQIKVENHRLTDLEENAK